MREFIWAWAEIRVSVTGSWVGGMFRGVCFGVCFGGMFRSLETFLEALIWSLHACPRLRNPCLQLLQRPSQTWKPAYHVLNALMHQNATGIHWRSWGYVSGMIRVCFRYVSEQVFLIYFLGQSTIKPYLLHVAEKGAGLLTLSDDLRNSKLSQSNDRAPPAPPAAPAAALAAPPAAATPPAPAAPPARPAAPPAPSALLQPFYELQHVLGVGL